MNNNLDNLLENKPFVIKDADKECPVCLDSTINNKYKELYQCLNCGKLYHLKCMNNCHTQSCILCKHEIE